MDSKLLLITLYSLMIEKVNPYTSSNKTVNDITSTDKNFYVYNLSSFRETGLVGRRIDYGSIVDEYRKGSKESLLNSKVIEIADSYDILRQYIKNVPKDKSYTLLINIDEDTTKRMVDLIVHLNYTLMTIYRNLSKSSVWYSDINISRALDMVHTTISKLIKLNEIVYDIRDSKGTYKSPTSLQSKLEKHISTFPLIKDILENINETPLDDMVIEAITIYEKHGCKVYDGTLSVLTAYKHYIMSCVEDELDRDLTELSIIGNTINRYNSLKGMK